MNRIRGRLDETRRKRLARVLGREADAGSRAPTPSAAPLVRRKNAGENAGLYAPLVPGAGRCGEGGRIGDALILALGAAFACGWALLAAAGLMAFVQGAGGDAFGR